MKCEKKNETCTTLLKHLIRCYIYKTIATNLMENENVSRAANHCPLSLSVSAPHSFVAPVDLAERAHFTHV